MIQFLQAVPDNPLLLNGILAGLLASVACGVMGPYVVTRRIVFLTGAIAHTTLGGIGGAILLQYMLRREGVIQPFEEPPFWASPLVGAILEGVDQDMALAQASVNASSVIGAVDTMRDLAEKFGRTFLKGQNAAAALFSPG